MSNIKLDKDLIIFNKLIINVLNKCYYDQLYGINKTDYSILYNKQDIFLAYYKTGMNRKITIKIFIIDFIKIIKKSRFNTLVKKSNQPNKDICVECNKSGNVFSYKNCGHKVHVECGLRAAKRNNRCNKCNTNIINETIYTVKIKKKEMCSICLEDTDIVLYKCGHHFHEQCLKELSESKNNNNDKCPMCRKKITDYLEKITLYENIKFSLGKKREGICDIQINKFL